MTLEIYINGNMQDSTSTYTKKKRGVEALKSKWWFLLANNDWAIYEVRESRMNWEKAPRVLEPH